VLTSDKSQLYAQRSKLAAPTDYVVLPETISKEPLGRSCVKATKSGWHRSLDPVRHAQCRRAGITSKNVEAEAKATKNPDVARLLGADGDTART
jgi:general L-amino acid transport system substrate-binding protein